MSDSPRDELKQGARAVLGIAIAAGVKRFGEWVATRPLQRAVRRIRERRRSKRK